MRKLVALLALAASVSAVAAEYVLDFTGATPLAAETIRQTRDQMISQKNPATGDAYSASEIAKRLEERMV